MFAILPASSFPAEGASNRPSYLFAIDAGHGGKDPGSTRIDGKYESEDTGKIANEVIKLLNQQGQRTVLINRNLVTHDRPIEANNKNADFLISLHRDHSSSSSARGINIYTHEPSHYQRTKQPEKDYAPAEHADKHEKDTKLVNNLKTYLNGATAMPFREIHYGSASAPTWEDYYINRLSNMPSCIIELGFGSNTADNQIFDTQYKTLAVAIVKALLLTVNLHYLEGTGKTGQCNWVLDNKVLSVSGNGAMGDYTVSSSSPWGNTPTSAEIGNGVTAIGNYSFYHNSSLTKISIPKTITKIGSNAFDGCSALAEVKFYGTKSDWNKITKGSGNSVLGTVKILYICDINGHQYDFVCDAECNVCGEKRAVTHTYSSVCDVSCNVCGAIRETTHTYSAACDAVCNICGYVRETEVEHIFDKNEICTVCGSRKYITGDLNGDLQVTDADAVYLLMNTFFSENYPANQPCDYNKDGNVTDADAVYLLMYTFFPENYPI
jgi:N-acetylmuramoyl-L-alanine amidase